MYNQTTEFRLTFSRQRGAAKRIMRLVLVVHTAGDVIPLLFANFQLVAKKLWLCSFFHLMTSANIALPTFTVCWIQMLGVFVWPSVGLL